METNTFPKESLSQAEIDGLLFAREEEKLARDVYNALYQKWNQRTFSNIAGSEQQHTSRIKELLDKYQLKDPVEGTAVGEFRNAELQDLYHSLVQKGSESLVDAFRVGAMIEDLDIKDLDRLLSQTDNQDIRFVYENLKKGSMNHMRSFYRQLTRYNAEYKAQYISQAELNAILASDSAGGQRNRNSNSRK